MLFVLKRGDNVYNVSRERAILLRWIKEVVNGGSFVIFFKSVEKKRQFGKKKRKYIFVAQKQNEHKFSYSIATDI